MSLACQAWWSIGRTAARYRAAAATSGVNRRLCAGLSSLVILAAPTAALAQTAPNPAVQTPPAGPQAGDAGTAQAGAAPEGNLFETIWKQDTLTGDWGGLRKQLVDAGITLGKTYPHPIVDLAAGRARALDAYTVIRAGA